MATLYVKSGAGATEFAQSTAYTSGSPGNRVVIKLSDAGTNFAVARKWVWECTTSGTTAAAEPTWPASVTQDTTTVTSNTAVFTARKPGFSSGTTANWAFATIYMLYGAAAASAGDTVYVSNNHAETQAASHTIAAVSGSSIVCVDDAAAPPTAVATTASVTTTGTSALTISGDRVYWYGINFNCGTGSSNANLSSINVPSTFESCKFFLVNTGTSSLIRQNSNVTIDCQYKFADATQQISPPPSYSIGCKVAAGGTSPTAVFLASSLGMMQTGQFSSVVENFDFSNCSAGVNIFFGTQVHNFVLINAKLPASWSGSVNASAAAYGSRFSMMSCDNTGTNYLINEKQYAGTLAQETTIVREGGANNGVTPISWKFVSNASSGQFPLVYVQSPKIVIYNSTVGSAITVTVEAVSSASVNNDEMWLEVSYLGTSGAPLGTLITSAKASILATAAAVPTSTATWTSSPATPVYQKMSVTFTPQLKGFIHAVVKLCKASKTVYVDPVLTITT